MTPAARGERQPGDLERNPVSLKTVEIKEVRQPVFEGVASLIGAVAAKKIFRLVDMVKFDLYGFPKNSIGSVDITYRCNLKCRHCYFLEQGFDDELTDEEWLTFFNALARTDFPFYQCSWVGGEPLLRKDLVGRLMKMFKNNLVATNGSIPLPYWPDANIYVSVDGTEPYYRDMRGKEHLYPLLKKNANRPDLRVRIAMVVTSKNYKCIDELIEEWSHVAIRSVLFQFYTPIRGLSDDLWPPWELRDKIIDHLIALKKRYGAFIENHDQVLRLMKSDVAHKVTRECLYAEQSFCIGPNGRAKKPCMMGEKADCSKCGCVLPFHTYMIKDRNLTTRELFRQVCGVS